MNLNLFIGKPDTLDTGKGRTLAIPLEQIKLNSEEATSNKTFFRGSISEEHCIKVPFSFYAILTTSEEKRYVFKSQIKPNTEEQAANMNSGTKELVLKPEDWLDCSDTDIKRSTKKDVGGILFFNDGILHSILIIRYNCY